LKKRGFGVKWWWGLGYLKRNARVKGHIFVFFFALSIGYSLRRVVDGKVKT